MADVPASILTGMASAPKKSRRTTNRHLLAETDVPDYANKSFDERVALFSTLVLENTKKPIYRVWSKLDPVARSVILFELGCFTGDTRRLTRAKHYEWAREDAAELKRHARMLRTFLEKQEAHEKLLARRPRFYMPHRYSAEANGGGTLRKALEIELMHLKWSVTEINRILKKRSKWDARGMILAQEYVKRRSAFLGAPGSVRLSPTAIADIYQLIQRPGDGGDDSDTVENIRKAIAYFRKSPENAYLIQNIEFYLQDWKMPALRPTSGN